MRGWGRRVAGRATPTAVSGGGPVALLGRRRFGGVASGIHTSRAAEIAPAGGKYRVVHAGFAETPPGAVKEGAVVEPQALGLAIRQVIAKAGIKPGRVVSAVRGQAVIVRVLKLPPMS